MDNPTNRDGCDVWLMDSNEYKKYIALSKRVAKQSQAQRETERAAKKAQKAEPHNTKRENSFQLTG